MYVEREIQKEFDVRKPEYAIVAIVGPRQAGKTTFLKKMMDESKVSHVMFDDPDALRLFDDDIKKFEKQYLEGYENSILDEVQYGKDAGKKLKYLADTGRKMWITSSSQTVLGKEVLSWLVGRVSILRLYPFSITEFLESKNQKEFDAKILMRNVMEHMIYGGYPKVVLTEDPEMKKTILKDLYETMVLKDISQTFSIENVRSLEEFSRYLAHSIGNVIVYEKTTSNLQLAFNTIKKYLDAMEKSYLIVRIRPFYTNKLKEITKQPKIYFIDCGLRNAIAAEFPKTLENKGKLFENYVLSELIKMDITPKYWQTKSKAEVDFVIEKNNEIIPVEVKLRTNPKKIELSLRSFITAYKPKRAIVVSYEGEFGELKLNGCVINFTDVVGLRKMLKFK